MSRIVALVMLVIAFNAQGDDAQVIPTRTDLSFQLNIVFAGQDTIIDKCVSLGAWRARGAIPRRQTLKLGCTAFNLETKICTVYSTPPESLDQANLFELLGHEVLHCAYGPYHPQ